MQPLPQPPRACRCLVRGGRGRDGQPRSRGAGARSRKAGPLWLAGGMRPENVGEVVEDLAPSSSTHRAGWRNRREERTQRSLRAFSRRYEAMQRYNDFFGAYGGRFVAEMLRAPLDELQEAFLAAAADTDFNRELDETLRDFAGRPTPLDAAATPPASWAAPASTSSWRGLPTPGRTRSTTPSARLSLHRRMGKTRIIAETGAGSTAWPPPPSAPSWASPAASTWAKSTCAARGPTCSGWSATAPRWSP